MLCENLPLFEERQFYRDQNLPSIVLAYAHALHPRPLRASMSGAASNTLLSSYATGTESLNAISPKNSSTHSSPDHEVSKFAPSIDAAGSKARRGQDSTYHGGSGFQTNTSMVPERDSEQILRSMPTPPRRQTQKPSFNAKTPKIKAWEEPVEFVTFTAGGYGNPPTWPRRIRWCVSLAVLILVVRIFRGSSVFTGGLDLIQDRCGSQDGASLIWFILACGFAVGIYHGYHLQRELFNDAL